MKHLAIFLVHAYRILLGPFSRGTCRFQPTCSAYALDAIDRHGAVRGLAMTFRRLSRCHPLGASGFDPVP